MKLRIVKNHFSPMCGDWDIVNKSEPTHAIFYRTCNFHCEYCNNDYHENNEYKEYSMDEFVFIVASLIEFGNRFKFTGGEATNNPQLKEAMQIVKQLGGYIFLDTNGSRPQIVKELIDDGLIDVLGISLKGISKERAVEVTHCKKSELCWDNAIETIRIGNNSGIRTIVTHVFYNDAGVDELEYFAGFIEPYKNVFLKMNNLLFDKHHSDGLQPIDKQLFLNTAREFAARHERWKGRIIVVNDESAISHYESVIFL